MKYCTDNEDADKIVSNIVEKCESLDSVYDYLDTLETESFNREVFSAVFNGLDEVVLKDDEKAYMLYALFGHHVTRPYCTLNNDELEVKNSIWQEPLSYPQKPLGYRMPKDEWELQDSHGGVPASSTGSQDVQNKLHFINVLLRQTTKAILKKDNLHITQPDEKFSFLKVVTYTKKEYPESTYFTVAPNHKKYLLVCGDCILSCVHSNSNHNAKEEIITTLLSLVLPVLKGISVHTRFDCYPLAPNYQGSFCYMDAR